MSNTRKILNNFVLLGMYKKHIFYVIKNIVTVVWTIEEHRGKEEEVYNLSCAGREFTSICPKRLRLFTKLQKLIVMCTSLEAIPDGIEYLNNLKNFEYFCNKNVGTDKDVAKLEVLSQLVNINLSNNNMKCIPTCFLSTLMIKNNTLNGSSKKFKNLKKIDFSDNQMKNIPISFFQHTSLEALDISDNFILSIPAEISKLSNLKKLLISGNPIQVIPDEICSLKQLESFNCSMTAIESIPDSFYQLTIIKKLALSNNTLKTLSPLVKKLVNLEELNVSYNYISIFPSEISSLLNLGTLDISHNKCESLSKTIFPTALSVLDISSNRIVLLPKIRHLKNLINLNISYNELTELSSDIGTLKNLECLDVSYNKLHTLPDNFGDLDKLQYLALDHNLLSNLPSNFSKLKKLVFLNLEKIFFTKIPTELFSLTKLKTLFFMNNFVESLVDRPLNSNYSEDTVENQTSTYPIDTKGIFMLKDLEIANFDNNKITAIPPEFRFLKKLYSLSFVNNKLTGIPEEIGELTNLRDLDIQANKIRYLPFSMKVLKQNKLTSLHLQQNFIPYNNSTLGLGIKGITDLKLLGLEAQAQYSTYITVEEVLQNMQKEDVYWNIDELKCIKLPPDISHYATTISDKQMRKMWRVVLKHFIVCECQEKELDSDSSDESTLAIERKITRITSSAEFKLIKNKALISWNFLVSPRLSGFQSLKKRVSNFLREISAFSTTSLNLTNELLKNYIKALFSKILDKIIEDKFNFERLELIKLALTDLCENKLFECIDGSLEGLQYYYSLYFLNGNESTDNSIIEFIKSIIASYKETTFIRVTNGDGINGVHDITKCRAIFKDLLGITYSFEDPYSSLFLPINSKYKKGSILNDFFKRFTVDIVCNEILDKINLRNSKVTESVDLLKHICKLNLPVTNDYDLYMDVIHRYFEYETIIGFSELIPKQLKKTGLIKILLHLKILETNTCLEEKCIPQTCSDK